MAYITQADKKIIAAALKVALKEFPTVKYSLSIQNHHAITCIIKQGPACLKPATNTNGNVNHYHIDKNHNEEAAKILNLINAAMHIGHWDESDTQTDYFNCAWYVHIGIGRWDVPFVVA